MGSSQVTSAIRVGAGKAYGGSGTGGGRRPASRNASRQRLVAIRYSHARSGERCSKPARPRHALAQRLLQRVLSVLHRAEDPIAVELKLASVGVGQLAERLLLALHSPRQLQMADVPILASQLRSRRHYPL